MRISLQRLLDVFLGERALSAQVFERPLQFFLKIFKHRSNSSVSETMQANTRRRRARFAGTSLRRVHQVLLQLPVGIHVSSQNQATGGIHNSKRPHRHSAAKLLPGLPESQRFAKRRKAGAKVGHGLGVEVVVQVGRQQAAVDLPFQQVTVDGQGLLLGGLQLRAGGG